MAEKPEYSEGETENSLPRLQDIEIVAIQGNLLVYSSDLKGLQYTNEANLAVIFRECQPLISPH